MQHIREKFKEDLLKKSPDIIASLWIMDNLMMIKKTMLVGEKNYPH